MAYQRYEAINWKQFKENCDGAPIGLEEIAEEAKKITTKSRQDLRQAAIKFLRAKQAFEDMLEEAGIERG